MWGLMTPFFFWDHLSSTEKTVIISVKTFFFGDHIIIPTKLRHFLRLFWSSQNRKSVIFELAPGPRSALGAPGRSQGGSAHPQSKCHQSQKCNKKVYCFFCFFNFFYNFSLAIVIKNTVDIQGPRAPLNLMFAYQFKCIIREKLKILS